MIREGNIGLRQLYCYLTFILLATGGTVVMTLPMSACKYKMSWYKLSAGLD